MFTFAVLNHFHLLTLQSKIAAYDFYLALERQTDNSGGTKLQVRSFPIILILLTTLLLSLVTSSCSFPCESGVISK